MNTCEEIQPVLFRIAEGEASPDEAIEAARHLSGCTVCRIRMARERRLGELIENDLAELPVDAGFVDQVMARIPREAPKVQNAAAKRKRGLKLAFWAGMVGLVGTGVGSGSTGSALMSKGLTTGLGGLGDGRGWESIVQGLIQGSWATVQAIGTSGLAILPTRTLVFDLALQGAMLSGAVLAAVLVASTMLTVMTRQSGSRI